ncbi:Nuclease-related domain-containing protein [Atopostipes suicloacalis DSM 15692]|uniref:Nuclease-related domain-containing protein n=1 Tax=Atopostipes suicloacalis DSM 15692 TaxID=1121025 RepID=A0A1M4XD16_9LACT|nr:nuclease-related domain-containing protein [Atopostipes suicloacalis]SHE91321.1 Nuclease-related domain-containing protein [Atopostipes suicloacalis DSM 15692]
MKIYQTEFQQKMAKFPNRLEFNSVAFRRGLITNKDEVDAFRRSVAGFEGEETVLDYFKKYGKKHWIVIPNLWMNYFGSFECDLVLFTKNKCYPIEIKNYFGDFTFKEGISTLNQHHLSVNPIFQIRRACSNLQEIFHKESLKIPVEGSLIFVGVDNYVNMQSEVSDLNIVTRNHLLHFIKKISDEEDANAGRPLDWHKIFPLFSKYEKENSFNPEPYDKKLLLQQAKKGISCKKCHDYQMNGHRHIVPCPCGYQETSKEAILRTINEYGVLTFKKDFTLNEILIFMDNQFSKTHIRKILTQTFKKIGNGRSTQYRFENI